jgi:hypothetical protein
MSDFKTWSEWLESRVGYKRIYLESIAHLPEHDRDFLIREAPHTRIKEVPDPRLGFLCGLVDLNFENLRLSHADKNALGRAFCGNGVRIPGTVYKLRYHGYMMYTVVEPAEGDEPELPADWRRVVYVMNNQDVFTWIGKRVRPEQVGNIDFSLYRDVGDGLELLTPTGE